MAYNTFTLREVERRFELNTQELNGKIIEFYSEMQPSEWLKETLDYNIPLAVSINTEKAKSELIVMPILVELRKTLQNSISIFSGIEFNVDKESGLNGRCDFLISMDAHQLILKSPIITLVEAKNDNIQNGMGQCVAEMVAAQRFNKTYNKPLKTIYGAVTTGSIWKFLKLEGSEVFIEMRELYIKDLPEILGLMLQMIQENKS